MSKIVVTGGSGRFGREIQKYKSRHKIFFPKSSELDILKIKKIKNYLSKKNLKLSSVDDETWTVSTKFISLKPIFSSINFIHNLFSFIKIILL